MISSSFTNRVNPLSLFKPYAIIDQTMFEVEAYCLKKEEPLG